MLSAANGVFKRFRYKEKSDALFSELKYVLDGFAAPLTKAFGRLGQCKLREGELFSLDGLRLCCRMRLHRRDVLLPPPPMQFLLVLASPPAPAPTRALPCPHASSHTSQS